MNLNIPRKQNLVGGSSAVDPRHLEQALLENFLAIERWANQQSVSACIAQTTIHSYAVSSSTVAGPWTVLWDQYTLADTANDRIKVPESGIYTGFVTGDIVPGSAAQFGGGGGGALGYVNFTIGGGSSFMTPSILRIYDNGVTSLTTSSISYTGFGHLMGASIFLASTSGYLTASVGSNSTAYTAQVTAFGFARINNIPSKVQ